ncbi:LegC family aminotransferase [Oceanobacillus kimchii]|uniref:LegC family aminotransferase n=1 Tax=Oceanobacillus kimchii TaxID=746691 RepID=UPI0009849304|nr:LegC family aminotransferase [Oceanobacillus kimchii]
MKSSFIPLSVPNLKGNELKYVTKAIEDEWVSTAGPYIESFEKEVARYVNVKGSVAVQNGTSGIHLALKALGVSNEDEVIAPTLTFIAAVNPITYCGASPVFMDSDQSLGLDAIKLRKFLEEECVVNGNNVINKSTNKVIKAIVVVHVFGNMADMEGIMDVADRYKLPVIEDATEAIGTYYTDGSLKGKYAGTIGKIGVFSFNGNKIMTTGGGGMIVSNDVELLNTSKHLSTQAKIDPLYYTHDEVGYNYRMTNIQAALGLAQLEQLEGFIKNKKSNYKYYQDKLESISGLSLIPFRKETRPNYWFYGMVISEQYSCNRNELMEKLAKEGIQSRPIWDLIHQQKPYRERQAYQINYSSKLLNHVINIPCSSNLTEKEIDRVISTLEG